MFRRRKEAIEADLPSPGTIRPDTSTRIIKPVRTSMEELTKLKARLGPAWVSYAVQTIEGEFPDLYVETVVPALARQAAEKTIQDFPLVEVTVYSNPAGDQSIESPKLLFSSPTELPPTIMLYQSSDSFRTPVEIRRFNGEQKADKLRTALMGYEQKSNTLVETVTVQNLVRVGLASVIYQSGLAIGKTPNTIDLVGEYILALQDPAAAELFRLIPQFHVHSSGAGDMAQKYVPWKVGSAQPAPLRRYSGMDPDIVSKVQEIEAQIDRSLKPITMEGITKFLSYLARTKDGPDGWINVGYVAAAELKASMLTRTGMDSARTKIDEITAIFQRQIGLDYISLTILEKGLEEEAKHLFTITGSDFPNEKLEKLGVWITSIVRHPYVREGHIFSGEELTKFRSDLSTIELAFTRRGENGEALNGLVNEAQKINRFIWENPVNAYRYAADLALGLYALVCINGEEYQRTLFELREVQTNLNNALETETWQINDDNVIAAARHKIGLNIGVKFGFFDQRDNPYLQDYHDFNGLFDKLKKLSPTDVKGAQEWFKDAYSFRSSLDEKLHGALATAQKEKEELVRVLDFFIGPMQAVVAYVEGSEYGDGQQYTLERFAAALLNEQLTKTGKRLYYLGKE